jgi:sec-independent protein translocase protein TatB
MLDFSWTHILIVLIVALVVVGPKDLPKLMRVIGQWVGKARAMADQFRKSFDEMARQSELDELRAEIEALRGHRPLADIDRKLNQSILPPDDLPPPASEPPAPAETVAPTAETAEPAPAFLHEPGDIPPPP